MSSKSPPSSALALNANFKHSEIPDGYKYDGDNFLTWTNGVTQLQLDITQSSPS